MRIDYNKLVRDKVPQAIEADGHTYSIASLSPNDFVFELKRKLVEEAQEALDASSHDDLLVELADLLEVIKTLLEASGISFEMLEANRQKRRKQKGGFEQRLLLRYVDRVG
jgi:predicted house-cleaning noncanonical NTP pyrophosphatase (MazG superfamily)